MRDYPTGDTVRKVFNTFSRETGLLHTLSGSPVLSVYRSGTSTPFTEGVSLIVDLDGKTGLNQAVVDTSNEAFGAGFDYAVVFTAGEVDGVPLTGTILFEFSLDRIAVEALRAANAYDALRPTTAGRELVVSDSGEVAATGVSTLMSEVAKIPRRGAGGFTFTNVVSSETETVEITEAS